MLVTIATGETPLEAHILKGALEQAGVPVYLAHEHHVWANWFLSNALGGVKVQVPGECYEQALAVLADTEQHRPDPPPVPDTGRHESAPTQCPACGVAGEPRVSGAGGAALFSLWLFAVPIPFRRSRWRCPKCGHTWKTVSWSRYTVPVISMVILLLVAALVIFAGVMHELCRIHGWLQACI